MKAHRHSPACEKIVADALRPVASELRLIDAADLIALLRFERHADLADLVTSASELYFMPDTVSLGTGGDYSLEWGGEPEIALDLEIRPKGVAIYVRLSLLGDTGGLEISHMEFDDDPADPEETAATLEKRLREATFRPAGRSIPQGLAGSMRAGANPADSPSSSLLRR